MTGWSQDIQYANHVADVVSRYFGINDANLLRSHKRTDDLPIARAYIALWLRQHTDLSYPQIGRWMNRHHTGIMHAERRLLERIRDGRETDRFTTITNLILEATRYGDQQAA